MLRYAIPNAPPTFERPPSIFADAASRPPSIAPSNSNSTPRPPFPESQQPSDRSYRPFTGTEAINALASLAANAPAALPNNSSSISGDSTRSSTPSNANMSQYAPAATPGGAPQNQPPVCANCSTSTTPLWRRDESGSVLCNACGLFLKLHGRSRPISLKTDVIKSRNRVKNPQAKKRDSHGGAVQDISPQTNGFAAAHPDVQHAHSHSMSMGTNGRERAQTVTPLGLNGNTAGSTQHNMGPPHLFDSNSDTLASPNIPAFSLRQPSPALSASHTGHHSNTSSQSDARSDTQHAYDSRVSQNNILRTRVSELEVINDLFRSRVGELEANEQHAQRNDQIKDEEIRRLSTALQASNARAAEMEERLALLEAEVEGPARKKAKAHHDDSRDDKSGSSTLGSAEGGGGGAESA